MVRNKKNKLVALFSLFLIATFGCTATGQIDWARIGGTVLQVAALNYTGPFVASVDTVFTAFTGEKLERPQQDQYGDYGYPQPLPQDQPVYPGQMPTDQSYPQDSWEQWGEPAPDPTARTNPAAGALSIDFALVKSDASGFTAMADGDRLRDGVQRSEEGDRFGIMFATDESVYVYIVNVDATGWAQTLFPYPDVPGYGNPVAAGSQVLLPNEQLYGLDDARGIETVFVLVSREPNKQLEAALEPLRGMERNMSIGARGSQARVTVPTVGQRGLVGIEPGASRTEAAALDRYFTAPATGEFAFSRWFVHE